MRYNFNSRANLLGHGSLSQSHFSFIQNSFHSNIGSLNTVFDSNNKVFRHILLDGKVRLYLLDSHLPHTIMVAIWVLPVENPVFFLYMLRTACPRPCKLDEYGSPFAPVGSVDRSLSRRFHSAAGACRNILRAYSSLGNALIGQLQSRNVDFFKNYANFIGWIWEIWHSQALHALIT